MDLNKVKTFLKPKRRNLITDSFPESKIAEEFRTIRTNVHIVTSGQKHKIILITSPTQGEGKSTVAANLAVSIAQQKERILLIDANLRKPSSHFIFNLTNTTGLTDILMGETAFEETVIHTEIDRLDVLISGETPNNPAELLGSQAMKELLQKVSMQYDKVIIDTSSVLDLTDTKLIANQSDEVLLVIHKGKTKIEKAAEAKKVLEFAKANVSGVIINEM